MCICVNVYLSKNTLNHKKNIPDLLNQLVTHALMCLCVYVFMCLATLIQSTMLIHLN